MCKEIDIRIVQLAKWRIPKTESAFGNENETSSHWAIGYFDMIDVKKVEYDMSKHPLTSAYEELHRISTPSCELEISENYSIQELIVFTDIDENEMSVEKIEAFWKNDSLVTFVSLLHIDNESDIDRTISKIKKVFENLNYMYYFSFDYSGIVLFAKDTGIKNYLHKMFELNYEGNKIEKLVRDSYSLYGFNKKRLGGYFKLFETKGYQGIENLNSEHFSVSVNIGIQNYNVYKEFLEELKNWEEYREYMLFGRHDVSIVNENATLKWLLYVQYLLDKYTRVCKERDEQQVFSTHETFVKVSFEENEFNDTENSMKNSSYPAAKEQLSKLCENFFEQLEKSRYKYNGEYMVPVQAVRYSILNILKNRFAEDFVLCMYQSFCEFLEYLIKQVSEVELKTVTFDESESEFDRCFSEYFRGLNALVNSAMHSERQFIQVTAFNAIIYDVPAKIMAFYVAVIRRIQQLVRGKTDKEYTFLLTPSFHNEISVNVISYYPQRRESPLDRILMVMINEKSLYNPGAVIRRMAHEIAHFVGDELRCREERKKRIEYSLICIVLNQILYPFFLEEQEYSKLSLEIYKKLPKDIRFASDENNYAQSLEILSNELLIEFIENEEIRNLIEQHIKLVLKRYLCEKIDEVYYSKKNQLKEMLFEISFLKTGSREGLVSALLKKEFCDEHEITIFMRLIMEDIDCELKHLSCNNWKILSDHQMSQSAISKIGYGGLNEQSLDVYRQILVSVYSESFADIQMVFLTGIGYGYYLKGFLCEESLDLNQLPERMEDLSRISMVAFVLDGIGIWRIDEEAKQFEEKSDLSRFHKIIKKHIRILKNSVNKDVFDEWFGEYKPRVNEFIDNIEETCPKKQTDIENLEEMDDIPEGDLKAIINLQLVLYLLMCLDKSLKHYGSQTAIKEIKKVREILNKVVYCESINEMFKTVCEELNFYKNKLFQEK